jgi:hypothetical protein
VTGGFLLVFSPSLEIRATRDFSSFLRAKKRPLSVCGFKRRGKDKEDKEDADDTLRR